MTARRIVKRMRLKFYRDRAGEWRWTLTHWNGLKVGGSSEGYVRRIDCESNASLVTRYKVRPGIATVGIVR